jgi:hypothetical protein
MNASGARFAAHIKTIAGIYIALATAGGSAMAQEPELVIRRADGDKVELYVDAQDQGGLRLRNRDGRDGAVLFVDDGTNHGILRLHSSNGQQRARLAIVGSGRGDLQLEGSDNAVAVRAYVDELNQGGLRLRGTAGQDAVMLFVSDANNSGVLRLHDSNGEARARIAVVGNGRGDLRLEGSDNTVAVRAYVDELNQGGLRLLGKSGERAAQLFVGNTSDNGILWLYDGEGRRKARFFVDEADQGSMSLINSDGSVAALVSVDDVTDAGAVQLSEADGQVRARLAVDEAAQGDLALSGADSVDRALMGLHNDDESGFVELRGQRFREIVRAERANQEAPNHGAVRVYGMRQDGVVGLSGELVAGPQENGGELVLYDSSGTATIVLDGATGKITKAGMNGFLIEHPSRAEKEILYVSLEGPEAGIYVRGTATLVDGKAEIALPEHFTAVAREDSVTVQLTPRSADTYGLAAVSASPQGISVRELRGGTGSFQFDYMVQAERGDVAPVVPVRDRIARRAQAIDPRIDPQRPRANVAADLATQVPADFSEDSGRETRHLDEGTTAESVPGDETSDTYADGGVETGERP